MPQAQGSNTKIIYDQEATYGTTPGAPASKVLPFISESLSQTRALVRTMVMRGNRNLTKPTRNVKDVGGNIKTELDPYMGILLKHLLGTNSDSGGGPNYTHTIKVAPLPVSLCIEKQFTDLTTPEYFLYNGCRIDKGSFAFKPDGYVDLSLDFKGQKETVAGSSFHASPTDLGHVPFETYELTLKEGGSTIAYVADLKFDVSNNLDGSNYVLGGAGQRPALPAGKVAVTGTLTALFQDVTLYTKATALTETSIEAILTRGTGDGTAGNELLDILIPELVYEQKAPPIEGDKGILVELAFSAYYDNDANASSIMMTLKNTMTTL